MKFFRIFTLATLSLFLTGSFVFGVSHASAIYYCSEYESYSCVESHSLLGEFLSELDGNYEYYSENGFSYTDEYVHISTSHFEIYVANYVIEDYFDTEDYSSGYFGMADWSGYDDDHNLMHDTIDYYAESLEDIYDWYADDYDLDIWWEGGIGDRMTVEFAYDYEGEGTRAGYYTYIDGSPYILINPYQETKYHVRGTIAHEMFHAIQDGYVGFANLFYNNFAEGTAVTLQSKLYNSVDEDYLRFDKDSSLQSPKDSVFGPTSAADDASYGSFLWYSFLHQSHGKGIILDLLESYREMTQYDYSLEYLAVLAVEDALEKNDSSLNEAYLEYSIWNYDKDKYTDGDKLRSVDVLNTHSHSVEDIYVGADEAPSLYGSNYVEFDVDGDEGELLVEFSGNDDAAFYLAFLSVNNGSVDYDNIITRYVDFAYEASIYVPNIDDYDDIVMIVDVININSEDLYTYDDFFNTYVYPYYYSAETNDVIDSDLEEDTDLGDYQVEEFFPSEAGTWWKYVNVYESLNGNEQDNTYIEALESSKGDNYFTYEQDGDKVEYKIFANDIQAYKYDGDSIDTTTVFSLDGYSTLVDKNAYGLFDIDPDVYLQLASHCTSTYLEEYEYAGISDVGVQEDCSYSLVDYEGYKYVFTIQTIYLRNIGQVYYESFATFEDEVFFSSYGYLDETSLFDLDVSEELVDVEDAYFTDLEESHTNHEAITYLYDIGVISGYDDGSFQPEKTVNRAELLKILVEGKGVSPDEAYYVDCFNDVADDWYAKYVCYAKEEGWVDGYPDGSFKPGDTVNKVEAIKMLLNSQAIETEDPSEKPFDDVEVDDWFAKYISKAQELGILEETGLVLEPTGEMARAGICENLFRLLGL